MQQNLNIPKIGSESAPALTIYKASAGSGKTFRLAVEYISLLVVNPDNYRNILAVTFTNKATAEMKMRILSQLYGIAKALKSSDGYVKEVQKNTGYPIEKIRQRAGKALSLLTHHYNYFRVQTIDAFFQTVMRNLARELNLTANLRVSLNDSDVKDEAVDEMIRGLKDNDKVLQWIGQYIQGKIDDNKSWNVIGSIKDFGQNIFKEFYQRHSREMNHKLSDPVFFDKLSKEIRNIRQTVLQSIVEPFRNMLSLIQQEGLDDPQWYSGGARSAELLYIRKVANGTFDGEPTTATRQKRIDDPEKWIAATKKKVPECQHLVALAESHLCEMLRDAEQNRIEQSRLYFSADLTLRHLSQLRLLHTIEQAVDDANRAANRFQLSNTQQLLHTMIGGSDTPFVFEKIGAQLHHIMIDEFQDTSTVQWQNFKVLLDDCLARAGSHSLIVGDVKQSIYRWRSGDWKLLNNMPSNAPEPMDTNYRSSRHVITFNNAFFQAAASMEASLLAGEGNKDAEQICLAYADVEQKVKHKDEDGQVDVLLLSADGYEERTLQAMAEHITGLLDQGVAPRDIAILVRENKMIPKIVAFCASCEDLAQRGVTLVSDLAFRLDASLTINTIVAAMRHIANPTDRLAQTTLVKLYQRYVLETELPESQYLAKDAPSSFLPDPIANHIDQLASMPLLDLIDHLLDVLSLSRITGQDAYVCAFRDLVGEYLKDHTADLSELLGYWDETLHEKTIQCDETGGIRLVTIHKSKGLEYDHIILPFCDWKLEQNSILWCQRQTERPFSELPIVPIDYSSKLKGTVYAADYNHEHLQNTVDNLNLLYVAFTRAAKTMLVIGQKHKPKKDDKKDDKKDALLTGTTRSILIENVLRALTMQTEGHIPTLPKAILTEDDDQLVFTYGSWKGEAAATEKADDTTNSNASADATTNENVLCRVPEPLKIKVETFGNATEFRQSNRSRDFISGEASPRQTYIQRGNLLHELFSHIQTVDDVEPALQQLEHDGICTAGESNETSTETLRQTIAQCFTHPLVREWFSPRWTLFNECTILTTDAQTGRTVEYRPDRVMRDGKDTIIVDFKFGHPRPEYHEQVRQYARLLAEMGETNVKTYLWYVLAGIVEEVPLQEPTE